MLKRYIWAIFILFTLLFTNISSTPVIHLSTDEPSYPITNNDLSLNGLAIQNSTLTTFWIDGLDETVRGSFSPGVSSYDTSIFMRGKASAYRVDSGDPSLNYEQWFNYTYSFGSNIPDGSTLSFWVRVRIVGVVSYSKYYKVYVNDNLIYESSSSNDEDYTWDWRYFNVTFTSSNTTSSIGIQIFTYSSDSTTSTVTHYHYRWLDHIFLIVKNREQLYWDYRFEDGYTYYNCSVDFWPPTPTSKVGNIVTIPRKYSFESATTYLERYVVELDGVDDYIRSRTNSSFPCASNPDEPITFEVMFKLFNYPSVRACLLGYVWMDGIGLTIFSDGRIGVKIHNDTGSYNYFTTYITLNTWYHVFATYSSSTVKIYVYNSSFYQCYTFTDTAQPHASPYDYFIIGKAAPNYHPIEMYLGLARVYNRVLCENEVLYNIEHPMTAVKNGLILEWNTIYTRCIANPGNNKIILDSSGNGNDGWTNTDTSLCKTDNSNFKVVNGKIRHFFHYKGGYLSEYNYILKSNQKLATSMSWIYNGNKNTSILPLNTPPDSISFNDWMYDGLVLWYMFNDTGSTVKDYSGNGNDGTIYGGAEFIKIGIDYSLYFDGVDDYVRKDTPISFPVGNSPITISVWTKPNQINSGKKIIFYGSIGSSNSVFFYIDTYKKVHFTVWGGAEVISTTILSSGNWYHIVGVYDTTKMYIYINGVLEDSADYTPLNLENNFVEIGGLYSDQFFNGIIDEVSIWNRTLSSNEKSLLYNNPWLGKIKGYYLRYRYNNAFYSSPPNYNTQCYLTVVVYNEYYVNILWSEVFYSSLSNYNYKYYLRILDEDTEAYPIYDFNIKVYYGSSSIEFSKPDTNPFYLLTNNTINLYGINASKDSNYYIRYYLADNNDYNDTLLLATPDNIIIYTLTIQDYTQKFIGGIIYLKPAYGDLSPYLVYKFNLNQNVISVPLEYQKIYNIYVVSKDGSEVRGIGSMVADTDTDKTFYIGLTPKATSQLTKDIQYSATLQDNQFTITLASDYLGGKDVHFNIYSINSSGTYLVTTVDPDPFPEGTTTYSYTYQPAEETLYRADLYIYDSEAETYINVTVYAGTGASVNITTPPENVPTILTVFTHLIGELPSDLQTVGYANILIYGVTIMVFALFGTKISLEIGFIGGGLTLLLLNIIIPGGSVNYLLAVSLIIIGALYRMTK